MFCGHYSSWHSKVCSADEAVKLIRSHYKIFLPGNCAVPIEFVNAAIHYAPQVEDVEMIQLLSLYEPLANSGLKGHIRINALFIGEIIRPLVNENEADFTPSLLSEVPLLFRRGILPLDIAVVHVSPPDQHGWCSLGIEAGLNKAPAECARIVIAEMNEQMPRVLGDCFIHVNKFDRIIRTSYPPLPYPKACREPDEIEKRIAYNAATRIGNGATLQTGIGPIPNGVLGFLRDRSNIGICTELFSDGVVDLVNRGVITCDRKSIHKGKIVTGLVIGTKKVFDFVDNNPFVEFLPTEYINNPFNIAKNNNMVAINGAIQVDLTGQVCADSIGSRLYSGIGGQWDFIYGASHSEGGMPIIVLSSTVKPKNEDVKSRIVSQLEPGAGVTISRYHVHYIATEYGITCDLWGQTRGARARELISIAHPKFREELTREAYNRWKIRV